MEEPHLHYTQPTVLETTPTVPVTPPKIVFHCLDPGCDEWFTSEKFRTRHAEVHRRMRKCEYLDCGLVFYGASRLDQHMALQHGFPVLFCDLSSPLNADHTCGKQFWTTKALVKHKYAHDRGTVQSYKCLEHRKNGPCRGVFANRKNMLAHMRRMHQNVVRDGIENCRYTSAASTIDILTLRE